MTDDWITIEEACSLLKVSRPTLNSYRTKKKLKQIRFRGRIVLSKTDIIKKVILPSLTDEQLDFTIFADFDFNQIQPIPGVFDLRKIIAIDPYGVMTLLCSIKYHLKENETNNVYLLLDDSFACSFLDSIGFFTEVSRGHADRVFANYVNLKKRPQTRATIILPLHLIGYRGAEKKVLDRIYDPLLKQGFSEDYCGHIGWMIGELCDNAHSHSHGPCYLIIEAMESKSTNTRYLSIAIGDTGIGIPSSLKTNLKYSNMNDKELLPFAFQSEVSRMEVEPKRGKGLNDIISIAKGNKSWLRVDSGTEGLFFDFRTGDNITFVNSVVNCRGTRFCLVLIEAGFENISRENVNQIMREFMEGM